MSLLTVGSMAFDSIETPFGKSGRIVGGAATYIVYCTSYFKNESNVISVVGGDFDKPTLEELENKGVNFDGLQIKENEKSFFWAGKYHNNMNSRDTLATELNVLETFDPIVPDSYQDCEYLMLGNLAPQVQMSVINQLKNKPKLIVLDTMNFWMDIALEPLKEVIAKIDVLTINDEEARQLSGEYSLVNAAKKIMEMGPNTLIIKKGEHGAMLFKEDKMFFCPAILLETVSDPTGAGDTFAGGFIGHLAQTEDLSFENMKRAIVMGSAMASFTCEKFGVERITNLTQDEIDARVNEIIEMSQFDMELV